MSRYFSFNYFNFIKHHIQFQYNCRGWGLGVGHYPQQISSGWPCSMFLALPNFDQAMWFSLSYFGPDPKFYPQFHTRSCTPLSKNDERSYLRKCNRNYFVVLRFGHACVLNIMVIGHYTINIFQVLMIFWVWQQNYWKLSLWGTDDDL